MSASDFVVKIDTRERQQNASLIAQILGEKKIRCESIALNPGDFHICYNSKILYMIERKELADFQSSVLSGHFHEQRTRMLETGLKANQLVLIVEGLNYSEIQNYPLFQSVITSTLQLGFRILYTKDIVDTAKSIGYMIDSSIKHKSYDIVEIDIGLCEIKSPLILPNIKKRNILPEEYSLACLQLVPGVSEEVARNILAVYGNIYNLFEALKTAPEPDKLLVNICHKGKKSPKLSEKIANFLN